MDKIKIFTVSRLYYLCESSYFLLRNTLFYTVLYFITLIVLELFRDFNRTYKKPFVRKEEKTDNKKKNNQRFILFISVFPLASKTTEVNNIINSLKIFTE